MSCDRTDLDMKMFDKNGDLKPSDENLTVEYLEGNKQLIDMIRFLIDDHAFSTDFYITAILEYFVNNRKG